MILVDIHAHMGYDSFKGDLPEVVKRAEKDGVKIIINNSTDKKTDRNTLKLAEKYSIIKAALGIHPTNVVKLSDKEIDDEIKFIEKNKNKIIAIGEVGLDYHWCTKPEGREKQRVVFKKFLELAKRIDKPIIIHGWDAVKDVLKMLEGYDGKVVLHCFEASEKQINKAIRRGYSFSIPPAIVRNTFFQKIAELVPLSKLLTETDAPFQAPKKEDRNEPSFISVTIKKLAEIKKMTEEEIANNIFLNYKNMFE